MAHRTLIAATLRGRIAVVIGFESTTDFAAYTDEFTRFVINFKLDALASGAEDVAGLLATPSVCPGTEGRALGDLLEDVSAALGEPVTVFHYHRACTDGPAL